VSNEHDPVREDTRDIERRLERCPPAPSRGFRTGLRTRLVGAWLDGHRPPRLGLLVAAYAISGVLLLAIAALLAF